MRLVDQQPRYKAYGDKAILIEWENKLSDDILMDILSFKQAIMSAEPEHLSEIIQSNQSLLLIYQHTIDVDSSIQGLHSIYAALSDKTYSLDRRLWTIPVCYDPSFGIDLDTISNQNNLPVNDIIDLHSQAIYTVFSIGFLPGFLYLGSLDKRLHISRKEQPRLKVPKGAVGIGGIQTGIYPMDSPGGWQIIGNSPIPFFDPFDRQPCFAKAGDQIQFKPISLQEHSHITVAIQNQTFTLKPDQL